MSKTKKKIRNWLAVEAWEKTGAGFHTSKKHYKREKIKRNQVLQILEAKNDEGPSSCEN